MTKFPNTVQQMPFSITSLINLTSFFFKLEPKIISSNEHTISIYCKWIKFVLNRTVQYTLPNVSFFVENENKINNTAPMQCKSNGNYIRIHSFKQKSLQLHSSVFVMTMIFQRSTKRVILLHRKCCLKKTIPIVSRLYRRIGVVLPGHPVNIH